MDLLFLDEFGDFSQGLNARGEARTDHPSWRPVCGYGGLLIPAHRYLEFCARFEQLRIIGLQMIRFAHRPRRADGAASGDDGVTYREWCALQREHHRRLYSKAHEVKGNEFFSGSYLNSPRVPAFRKRHVYRRIDKFLAVIENCGGQVFYWGIEKQAAASRRPVNRPRSLHLNLLPGVIRAAHAARGCGSPRSCSCSTTMARTTRPRPGSRPASRGSPCTPLPSSRRDRNTPWRSSSRSATRIG